MSSQKSTLDSLRNDPELTLTITKLSEPKQSLFHNSKTLLAVTPGEVSQTVYLLFDLENILLLQYLSTMLRTDPTSYKIDFALAWGCFAILKKKG